MNACTVCGRQLAEDSARVACRSCEHSTRHALLALAGELPRLAACLVPAASGSSGAPGAGRAHAPLPLDLRVLNLLGPGTWSPSGDGAQLAEAPLVGLLRYWADRLADAFPRRYVARGTEYVEPYGGCTGAVNRAGADVAAWCNWLARYVPYAVDLPLIAELHHDLVETLRRVRAITGTRPATHVRLAPCPDCGACAMTRTDGQWSVVCEACGNEMDPDDYAAHAAAVLPGLGVLMARLAAAEVEAVAS